MLPFFFSWVSSFTDQNFETVCVNAKIIRLKFVTNIYCWLCNGHKNPLRPKSDDEQGWTRSSEQWGMMTFGQGRFCWATSITAMAWIASACLIQRPTTTLASLLYLNCLLNSVAQMLFSSSDQMHLLNNHIWILLLHIFNLSPEMPRQLNVFWATLWIPIILTYDLC